MLKEICKALMESDINIRLIQNLRKNIKTGISLEENTGASNKKRNIQKVGISCIIYAALAERQKS